MFTEISKNNIPACTKGKKGEYAIPTMQKFYLRFPHEVERFI